MEYSDIHKNKTETNDCNKENAYVNTIFKTGTIEFVKQNEEEHYEQLRFKKDSLTRTGQASVPETGTSKICFLDGSLKRMQILLYINLTVSIVLCLALIVVVIVITVPKDKVDGNWGEWSAWSFCDVKCGKGSQTRLRTCTNPPATGGGRACSGKAVDILICEMPSCKVDGNWGEWSAWSFCDVTCGNGSQTRLRTCTNPPATGGGRACSGKAIDIFVCEMPSCKVDGIWGEWSAWSFCDVTCGNGSQTRLRTCTNPPPTGGGRPCSGKAIDNLICEMQSCKDGEWTSWGSWSACSMTCGGGMQSSSRSCSNPYPSILGNYCAGDAQVTRTCNSQRCPPIVSTFSVYTPYNYTSLNGTYKLTFSHTIYQHGGDFNASTGTLTCSIPGTYHFSVTLVKKRSSSRVDMVYCRLYKTGSIQILIKVDPTDDDTDKGHAAVSQSVVLHLVRGDTVYLSGCTNPPSTFMDSGSSFTGFLLYPDS